MELRKKKSDALQNQAWLDWLNDDASQPAKSQRTKSTASSPRQRRQWVGVDGLTSVSRKPSQHALYSTQTVPKDRQVGASPQLNWRAAKPKSTSLRQPGDEDKDIAINIHLPRVKLPKVRLPSARFRWALLALVVIVFGSKFALDHAPKHSVEEATVPVQAQASADLGYKPLTPTTTGAATSPTKPVYNSQKQLYTYNDQYEGANLTVDQQAIPAKVKGNQTEIAKIAASINATDSFTTTLGKVYIFTSEDSDSQRLMLATSKMLMFIQSTQKLDTSSWVEYIQNLQ